MFHSNSQRIGGITLAAILLLAAGAATAGGAKIDKIALGKPPQGVNITVSFSGQHVAWQSTQGSRAVMVVDGVVGPPFDELLLGPSGGTVAFSNDGSRYAYFGREGDNYILIVDGKDMAHGSVGSSRPYSRSLAFSPGGKHVFYLESDSTKGYRLVMDGTPGPWSSDGRLGPAFSPNDEHYAYNGPERENSNKWFTVIDGKQRDFLGNDLKYTGDGRLISIMPTSDGQVLMVNGLPVAKGTNIGKIWAAPTGPHYAAAVQPAGGSGQVLYMDGKPVADCTSPGDVIFSSDGRDYAATCSAGAGSAFVVVIDGKKGQEYRVIDHVAFAPESATAIYVARNSQYKTFVVVGGKEFGPYTGLVASNSSDSGLVMSRTGGHYIFASEYRVGVPEEVVFDGRQMQFDNYELRYEPTMSANGARYAFAVFRSGNAGLVVDGKPLDGVVPQGFLHWPGEHGYAPLVLLSPNGKHVVYVATPKGVHNRWALFLDSKPVYLDSRRRAPSLLAFTPDSRHLYWQSAVDRSGPDDLMLYLDGKAILQRHPSSFDSLDSAWHMDADGTVQFLSFGDDGTVLRYRVTPAADNGVQTLLAGAEN